VDATGLAPPLTPRQREALLARFGRPGDGPKPLSEVAADLGVTESRVSQLCTAALEGVARICRARELGVSVDAAADEDAAAFAHLLSGSPACDDVRQEDDGSGRDDHAAPRALGPM
jgi:DNA-binding transcriptional regulator YdaS (Cro superfamily)